MSQKLPLWYINLRLLYGSTATSFLNSIGTMNIIDKLLQSIKLHHIKTTDPQTIIYVSSFLACISRLTL